MLEAAIPPALAERLPREAAFAARRAGRARGAAVFLAWLDTAEGTLAAQGLALEQPRRGPRTLLRSLPPPATPWHPGLPAATEAELPEGEAPAAAGEEPLVPIAAFEGRRTTLPFAEGVEAVLVAGRLRAVVAEAEAARLTLSGPPDAVIATMQALAAELPCLPARATLAEEGRALARGEAPRPRRLGAPELDPAMDVEGALVLALGHLTEAMLWHAPAARAGTAPDGVHQMRVALRRLRSLLRAFRPACDGPALRGFDAELRGLAAVLGPARDWDVWLGGLGAEIAATLPGEPRIAALMRQARAARDAAYAGLRPVLDGPDLRRVAWQAVALAELRPWRGEASEEAAERRARPLPDFAAGVLERRWRRLAEAGEGIDELPDEAFHELRIDAKRMRYAAELFHPLWPRKRARRFLVRLAAVQEEFGLANDAAVARALVGTLGRRGGPRGGRDGGPRGERDGGPRGERDGMPRAEPHGGGGWAAGVAEGWALARARRARRRATVAWKELLATEPFWA